jgi:dihydrofolate synthase/folylpolyglutamate synthase
MENVIKNINYDLRQFRDTLAEFHNPHRDLKNIIHIAGTNGKGSTLTFIANAIQELRFTVGTYTSPHILSYRERFQINNVHISENDYNRLLDITNKSQTIQTEFERLTLMAFLYFQEKNPDYLIIETGLGGRLDATNVISPILSIITKIGFDHEAILGNTIEKIAQEKAGIIKPNVPVITIQQSENILKIFHEKTKRLHVVKPLENLPKTLHMQGLYQKENLALAQKAISLLFPNASQENIFDKAHIWGRFEKCTIHNQEWIIDGAHNPDGIASLIDTLKTYYPNQKFTFITSILKTKNATEILHQLAPLAHTIYYCCFDPELAHSYHEITQLAPQLSIIETTLEKVFETPYKNPVLTGSIYFISHVNLYKNGD